MPLTSRLFNQVAAAYAANIQAILHYNCSSSNFYKMADTVAASYATIADIQSLSDAMSTLQITDSLAHLQLNTLMARLTTVLLQQLPTLLSSQDHLSAAADFPVVPALSAVAAAPVAVATATAVTALCEDQSGSPVSSRSPVSTRSSASTRSPASRSSPAFKQPLPQPPASSTLCFYHYHFQRQARKCQSPCTWQGN
jgi:hypothetical protein